MPRRTSKFRPIHHQQLPLKPRDSTQRFQVLRSHRKNLRRGRLEATTGKEDVPNNLLVRSPRFGIAVDIQILRKRNPVPPGPGGYRAPVRDCPLPDALPKTKY